MSTVVLDLNAVNSASEVASEANTYASSALLDISSLNGITVPSDFSMSGNLSTIISTATELLNRTGNVPSTINGWTSSIVEYNLAQLSAVNGMPYYAIEQLSNGMCKVYGLGEPMTISAKAAQNLQNAINALLSVTSGNFINSGGLVNKNIKGTSTISMHALGLAFDVYNSLGIRVNYNNGADMVTCLIENEVVQRSANDVFYVTCEGGINGLFNCGATTAYAKVLPGMKIPDALKQYITNGVDDVIGVYDVATARPSPSNMYTMDAKGTYINVSELFASFGWTQIKTHLNTDTYLDFEWHHFQYTGDASASTQTGSSTTQISQVYNKDLKQKTSVTADELDSLISYVIDEVNPSRGKTSKMRGLGEAIIAASEKTGLDPMYILAHAALETGWGTSEIVQDKGNWFGIGAFNGTAYDSAHNFSRNENGLIEGAIWIKENYYDNGQTTLDEMITPGHCYACYDDGTPNTSWRDDIAKIMLKGENYIETGSYSLSNSGSSSTYNQPNTPGTTYVPSTPSGGSSGGYSPISDIIVTPPAPTIIEPTNIIPENKFTEALPVLSDGTIGYSEISKSHVMYEINNIGELTYNNYINSLKELGYSLSPDGKWVNENYTISLIKTDTGMNISLTSNVSLT